ncbi:hypothetical protein NC652_026183 [Populus alba x Populus x berolinensis]|nr:hypothetical protein NC652_026183 [Populus alba x Populus x berolinensis]
MQPFLIKALPWVLVLQSGIMRERGCQISLLSWMLKFHKLSTWLFYLLPFFFSFFFFF